jgi:hypothetical protein
MRHTSIAGVAVAGTIMLYAACVVDAPYAPGEGTNQEFAHSSAALDFSEVPGETAIELDELLAERELAYIQRRIMVALETGGISMSRAQEIVDRGDESEALRILLMRPEEARNLYCEYCGGSRVIC